MFSVFFDAILLRWNRCKRVHWNIPSIWICRRKWSAACSAVNFKRCYCVRLSMMKFKNRQSVGNERELNECAIFRLPSTAQPVPDEYRLCSRFFRMHHPNLPGFAGLLSIFFRPVTGRGSDQVRFRHAIMVLVNMFSNCDRKNALDSGQRRLDLLDPTARLSWYGAPLFTLGCLLSM